ncbi:hypothetical protein [Achromobacter aloeverae]|nr:hypothetical protein [Achromobacter aloeverae]
MPPLSSLPPAGAAGFQPVFFSAAAAPVPPDAASAASAASAAETCYYSHDKHGTFERFRRSDDYARVNARICADFDALGAFMDTHAATRADHVRKQFNTFLKNLDSTFFDTLIEGIYGSGAQALHEAACIVEGDHVGIRPEDKIRAIERLADGITVCASGVVANLAAVARDLAHETGGLRGKIWRVKEQAVAEMLQQRTSRWFQKELNQLRDDLSLIPQVEDKLRQLYEGNEIHYVNRLWDEMADSLGLTPRNDPLRVAMPINKEIPAALKVKWRSSILAALKPSVIALAMADETLAAYRGDVRKSGLDLEGERDGELAAFLADIARAAGERLGLPADDALNVYGLVAFQESRYRVRDDASVLAVELLARMETLGLISGRPVRRGTWSKAPGGPVFDLLVYEDLAWKVEGGTHGANDVEWADIARHDAHPLTLADLRDWSAAQAQRKQAAAIPPQGALRHVIDKTAPDRCAREIPVEWITDTDQATHRRLRDRLGLELPAYAVYLQHRWPAQLDKLVGECEQQRVDLQELYGAYKRQPGRTVLPPLKLVLACMDLTYTDHCVGVLKHWPADAEIDRRLGRRLNVFEFAHFKLTRLAYLASHKDSVPQAWP